jgi:hypothetical protein
VSLRELVFETRLVRRFEKPRSEMAMDVDRCANDLLGELRDCIRGIEGHAMAAAGAVPV